MLNQKGKSTMFSTLRPKSITVSPLVPTSRYLVSRHAKGILGIAAVITIAACAQADPRSDARNPRTNPPPTTQESVRDSATTQGSGLTSDIRREYERLRRAILAKLGIRG